VESAPTLKLEPGLYSARVFYANLAVDDPDAQDGDDCYRVVLWKNDAARLGERRVLKSWTPVAQEDATLKQNWMQKTRRCRKRRTRRTHTMLTEAHIARIEEICKEYPIKKSALVPALYVAQRAYGGWLPREAMVEVAEVLDLPESHVYAVASFYSMFYLKPVGKNVVPDLHHQPCELRGARGAVDLFKQKLGVNVGETTEDGNFTLMEVECLAACDKAPMCQINETITSCSTKPKSRTSSRIWRAAKSRLMPNSSRTWGRTPLPSPTKNWASTFRASSAHRMW
jgi:NADH:ubiquinone oxidoreductase subunit E